MKLGSSRGMDTKRPRRSERSKPCHKSQLTRRSQPSYPWPPEQAQSGVSKPYRTTDACTGEGIAVLTLQDYTLGTPLTASDFVSFSYESEQNSFSVDSSELQKITGALPAVLPSSASVSIVVGTKDEIFMSSTGGNGGWFAGPKGSVDAGLFSSWSAGAVPEPSTWAMLLIGFGGVGYAGYRRARITPRAA